MQTPTPVHHLAAERHAELVDRLCEVPDGPDRRESIAKLLANWAAFTPNHHEEAASQSRTRLNKAS